MSLALVGYTQKDFKNKFHFVEGELRVGAMLGKNNLETNDWNGVFEYSQNLRRGNLYGIYAEGGYSVKDYYAEKRGAVGIIFGKSLINPGRGALRVIVGSGLGYGSLESSIGLGKVNIYKVMGKVGLEVEVAFGNRIGIVGQAIQGVDYGVNSSDFFLNYSILLGIRIRNKN
jgi:hypothetical protein